MNADQPITGFGPDFPFAYDDWLSHPSGLGAVPEAALGEEVAIIGAGLAGMVAAYELMKLGLRPVMYEQGRIGGRLRSEKFQGADNVIAELGGMRFPVSSRGFYHYVDLLGLKSAPFPNPLAAASPSTVIDLEGVPVYIEGTGPIPQPFAAVQQAWAEALESQTDFAALQDAVRRRDVADLKTRWNQLVAQWDERTFYDFIAASPAFSRLSFHHREIFGQVGFGTGGWDSDFPNSMLEILRVVLTELEDGQRYIEGGVEQLPRGLWAHAPDNIRHWPAGTSLSSLHSGAPRPGAAKLARDENGMIAVTDRWGDTRRYKAVLSTCQTWLLTTSIETDEKLFAQKLWMALDRTRYMQSSKTFVMVDRPFWTERDPLTGRFPLSTTLSDRITRGTYLFDNGPDQPAVICLSYSWMSDALKVLPLPSERRVALMLRALRHIYPDLDISKHIIGDPITVSWESDPGFLGAFKGALPGHYRYNRRMFCHFMQHDLPPDQRGIYLAGDEISFTPAWAEGAVQTALNALSGIMHQFGGASPPDNPGPVEQFAALAPLDLGD